MTDDFPDVIKACV